MTPEKKVEPAPLVPPFVRYVASAIPMVFDDSLSYYECLAALTKYLQDVVKVINNNGAVTEEYIQFTKDLKEYMDNYFENLDVQEEINNKLDQMALDGTLQEIITAYIQANVAWTFDTVADMKLAENFVDGSYAQTLGYHTKNDGGKAIYKIRTITNDDVVDEGSIIELHDDTLIAELILDNYEVNVKQFGAYGDGEHDDIKPINNAVTYLSSKVLTTQTKYRHSLDIYPTIYFPNGKYKTSTPINFNLGVNCNFNIKGENSEVYSTGATDYSFNILSMKKINIDNFIFTGYGGIKIDTANIEAAMCGINNCIFMNNIGAYLNSKSSIVTFYRCRFDRCIQKATINEQVDFANYHDCWFNEGVRSNADGAYFEIRAGKNYFDNCEFIPSGTIDGAYTPESNFWFDVLDNRNFTVYVSTLYIDKCRFSQEDGCHSIVNWNMNTGTGYVDGFKVSITNCWHLYSKTILYIQKPLYDFDISGNTFALANPAKDVEEIVSVSDSCKTAYATALTSINYTDKSHNVFQYKIKNNKSYSSYNSVDISIAPFLESDFPVYFSFTDASFGKYYVDYINAYIGTSKKYLISIDYNNEASSSTYESSVFILSFFRSYNSTANTIVLMPSITKIHTGKSSATNAINLSCKINDVDYIVDGYKALFFSLQITNDNASNKTYACQNRICIKEII